MGGGDSSPTPGEISRAHHAWRQVVIKLHSYCSRSHSRRTAIMRVTLCEPSGQGCPSPGGVGLGVEQRGEGP